jgi:DmsE family decaheme c-type cytochrome
MPSQLGCAAALWMTALACLLHAGAALGGEGAPPPEQSAPPYSAKGADTCLGCHDDPEIVSLFRTAHARPDDPRGPFGHGGLQCEACHGPGGAHVKARGRQAAGIIDFGKGAHAKAAQQNAMCLTCHQGNTAHQWGTSVHAAHEVACADCHKLHQVDDPVRRAATQEEVCGQCHAAQRAAVLWKPSRHPVREGKMACTSCHSAHGSSAPASLLRSTVNETCTGCHSELRGPFLWEHQPVSEDCRNCHDSHGSAQPALLTARAPFLCQRCHEAAGHPSAPGTPQGLPGAMPSAFLLVGACLNCHSQVHGSNHPSGRALMR